MEVSGFLASFSLARPAFYGDLDLETLFFIFYYQPGTPQQYYAARELKRQMWFYHKELQQWLQRHGDAKVLFGVEMEGWRWRQEGSDKKREREGDKKKKKKKSREREKITVYLQREIFF